MRLKLMAFVADRSIVRQFHTSALGGFVGPVQGLTRFERPVGIWLLDDHLSLWQRKPCQVRCVVDGKLGKLRFDACGSRPNSTRFGNGAARPAYGLRRVADCKAHRS